MSPGKLVGVSAWLSEQFQPASPAQKGRGRSRLLILCAVTFLTSVGVRLLYFQDMRREILHTPSLATTMIYKYEEEKQRMFDDGGMLFPNKAVDPSDARMLFHPPGHSILLAAIYGNATPDRYYTALRLLHVFSGALASVLIVLIAAQLLPLAVAAVAGFLASVSPHLAYHALWLTPDSLCVVPILASVYLLIRASKRPRLITVIAAGAMLGLSVWLRTNALLLAPMLAIVIVMLFERGKRLRYATAFVCASAAVILPVTIRNWVVYHRFVPVTLGSGLLLVEGIAEYDPEGKFGMAAYDGQVCLKDVEWHGRRDYRHNPWFPDGIYRDRVRFERGLAVLRSHPIWSLNMMSKRMAFMVRYNDFRPTPLPFRTSRAPSVSWSPPFGHSDEIIPESQPVFAAPQQAWTNDRGASKEALLVSEPFTLKAHTDYMLRLSAVIERGEADLQVKSSDSRLSLGEKKLISQDQGTGAESSIVVIPFTSSDQTMARVVVSDAQEATEAAVEMGRIELIELGPTPYQWTRPFRAVTRALQQNIFKTDYMRLLIVAGVILLGLAGQRRVLLILLAVPLYYLFSHAPFGIDYRYTLPIHYFLFVCAAAAIHCAGVALARLAHRGMRIRTRH